jgi:hypothetical protein
MKPVGTFRLGELDAVRFDYSYGSVCHGVSPAEYFHIFLQDTFWFPCLQIMVSSVISLPSGYVFRVGYPSVPDYVHLRSLAGLSPKTTSQAAAVATGSWYGCYITLEGKSEPVGMGRIIGDGGW